MTILALFLPLQPWQCQTDLRANLKKKAVSSLHFLSYNYNKYKALALQSVPVVRWYRYTKAANRQEKMKWRRREGALAAQSRCMKVAHTKNRQGKPKGCAGLWRDLWAGSMGSSRNGDAIFPGNWLVSRWCFYTCWSVISNITCSVAGLHLKLPC